MTWEDLIDGNQFIRSASPDVANKYLITEEGILSQVCIEAMYTEQYFAFRTHFHALR